MRLTKLIISTVILALLFAGCSKQESEKNSKSQKFKELNFTLKDINNTTISLKTRKDGIIFNNLDGKIVFLDFFATWCPPCRAEIPHLVNLQKKYKDKLVIIGILLEKDKNIGDLQRFKEEYKINYFISNSNDNFELAKTVYATVQAPKNMPIPLMAIYKDGKYITHYLGAVPEEMIESDIKNILGE
jgi:thiol-disulfide isomerase/thioredoxin